MKNKVKNIFSLITLASLMSGCINDSFETPVQDTCVSPSVTKTKKVADLYTSSPKNGTTIIYHHYIDPTDPTKGEVDDYIEAYIISSDEGGNFYKSMYFQPLDGSKGFNLSIDEGNVYTKNFQVGKKVFLKLNGLAYANPLTYGRGLLFGATPTDVYAVDRLASSVYKNYLIPSCDIISEDAIVKKITLAQASSDTYLNTLVEIDDVQFKTDCTTYSNADFDTSLKITDGTKTLDLRTSRYANFAGYQVPLGSGTIRGILTKYNSLYQIIIRTQRDVKLTNPRVQTVSLPKVGTNLQYLGSFSENFESYAATTSGANFPKYINDAAIGSKYWDVVLFSKNKYIKASAFNNGCTKSYFIVPVDFTVANGFSFKTEDGYNDGDPLTVYYSTDYIPGNNVSQATLVNITHKFKISTGNTSSYAPAFISSGTYLIPTSLTGNGYFIFEYDGTTGITTTMQIDDIVIN
ncbi:DUF5689 domain-containing protein [Flavobacterium cellulosilyticum]|uniref:DUF5689 domain-containing protein n=1 Tax=Flavobacterium cellulosilyticum TaxID=2541731 RepID=A0A4R5CM55_9FLAO|nr:DUF5689 domain-containing protein [Flavobacterium cellulosilyticum]TDD99750.1 hypothetical protein E0F76_03245 [Flavobacterium cellulosilyticum]